MSLTFMLSSFILIFHIKLEKTLRSMLGFGKAITGVIIFKKQQRKKRWQEIERHRATEFKQRDFIRGKES